MNPSIQDYSAVGLGLLTARLVLGLLMAGHGAQKLFGWFGGHGLQGTGGFFETLGYRPGRLFAAAAGLTEVTGGLLIALGLLGPVGPALVVSVMIVAAVTVHWNQGVFATSGGFEVPLLYATGAIAIALTGHGAFSLDAVTGLQQIWSPALVVGALAIGVLGGIVNLLARRPAMELSHSKS
jgi:putative oxidoreductase